VPKVVGDGLDRVDDVDEHRLVGRDELGKREPTHHFEPQPVPLEEVGVCVKQIQEKAGVSQSTASQFMQTLQRAGLVTSHRRGAWTYYRRDSDRIATLPDLVRTAI
jgi:ArsR family transcriptional regulator